MNYLNLTQEIIEYLIMHLIPWYSVIIFKKVPKIIGLYNNSLKSLKKVEMLES